MTGHTSSPLPLTAPFQIAAALVLTYLITVHSLAGHFAVQDPQASTVLNASEPTALTRRAERALPALVGPAPAATETPAQDGGAPSRLEGFARLPKLDLKGAPVSLDAQTQAAAKPEGTADAATSAEVSAWLERAIASQPLNTQAIALLGVLAIGANDDAKAGRLMSAASKRSGRVPLANYWLMRSSFEAKDYAQSLNHADRLLRNTPANITLAAPFLGRIAEASPAEMAEKLAESPAWRPGFFANLKGNIQDPRTPMNFLLKLKGTANAPAPSEYGAYVALLMENGYLDLAYGAWLQSLSAEQLTRAGFIYNGGFDFPPSGYPFPFEWTLTSAAGVLVDIITPEGEDANNVLLLKFGPGRTAYRPVNQVLMLMPGAYTLKARHRGDIKSRRGLHWVVECIGNTPVTLAKGSVINGAIRDWAPEALDFTVPQEGCRSQNVKLALDARSPSETMVAGSLQIDDVSILRQGETHNTE